MSIEGLKQAIGTTAGSFNEREMQICTVARMVEDAKTYWVAGGGGPMYAVLLGIKLYTPGAQYITEDGVIAPEPMLPFEPIMTMVSSRAGYRALAWGTMNTAGNHAQLGLMDYGCSTAPGRPAATSTRQRSAPTQRSRRFGGRRADSIAALCWRTILMTDRRSGSSSSGSTSSPRRGSSTAAKGRASVRGCLRTPGRFASSRRGRCTTTRRDASCG
jgi:hypothetical protein